MHLLTRFAAMLFVIGSASICVASGGASLIASTDAAGYTGTIQVFNTLNDAQLGLNPRTSPFSFNQRDAEVYVVHNRPTFAVKNANIFLTTIDYTTADNTNGFEKDDPRGNNYFSGLGNPNRADDSFVQMYDSEGHTDTSVTGWWTSLAYDTFTMNLDGATTTPGIAPFSRMWNAGQPFGGEALTSGDYLSWHIELTATGLVGQDLDHDGFFESTNHPSDVFGTLSGIFQNRSSNPASAGFYRFSLDINHVNWALSQGDLALNGNLRQSRFGAVAVPEPGSAVFLLVGFLAFFRKKS